MYWHMTDWAWLWMMMVMSLAWIAVLGVVIYVAVKLANRDSAKLRKPA